MAGSDAHRFRCFVDVECELDVAVALPVEEREHLRVLRLGADAEIELVDSREQVWLAQLSGSPLTATPRALLHGGTTMRRIELIAGALVGGKFDELVDGAVQAGADRIVPLSASNKDAARLTERTERLQRIAWSAAKQSKRTRVPRVAPPIGHAELVELEPGIVLDASAEHGLDTVDLDLAALADGSVRVLIGPADGLDAALVARLVERGWTAARLGPSILRAELAAAVAVALVAMRR